MIRLSLLFILALPLTANAQHTLPSWLGTSPPAMPDSVSYDWLSGRWAQLPLISTSHVRTHILQPLQTLKARMTEREKRMFWGEVPDGTQPTRLVGVHALPNRANLVLIVSGIADPMYQTQGFLILFDSLGKPRAALFIPFHYRHGADGLSTCLMRLQVDSISQFSILSDYIGCGGPGFGECILSKWIDYYAIDSSFQFDCQQTISLRFGNNYRDTASGEVLYFEEHTSPTGNQVGAAYQRFQGMPTSDMLHFLPVNGLRLRVVRHNIAQREMVVQFPGSATTYTLTFSPNFETLTSQGSDGSAVQTFVRMDAP